MMRQAIPYYGSKWTSAPWIIDHFPPHESYIEPCGGSASVLLQKPRVVLETLNDVDGNIVNFFTTLRDRPGELARALELTPWARDEFETVVQYDDPNVDELERARRFAAFQFMGISKRPAEQSANQWRRAKSPRGRFEMASNDLTKIARSLGEIAGRLIGVQIENRHWLDVVGDYDNEHSLIYFDPPYPTETRSQKIGYRHEWTNGEHVSAANRLDQCDGFVVVSSYCSELYVDTYERWLGWSRFDSEPIQTNSGGARVESIWLSPKTVDALRSDFGPLFESTEV